MPPAIDDLIQADSAAVTAFTASDKYLQTIEKIVQALDDYFTQQITDLEIRPTGEDSVRVDMEHILDKFFTTFMLSLHTKQGQDELAAVVAGDVVAQLVNLGYDASRVVRYTIGADNLYSTIVIKQTN